MSGRNDEPERCCHGGMKGARCLCMPYNDPFMISAQILSIVAVCVSWIWWVSFVIGIPTMSLLQVLWCCRQHKAGLIFSVMLSVAAAGTNIAAAIYFLRYRKDTLYCEAFTLAYDDDWNWRSYTDNNMCPHRRFASIAIGAAVLWMATGICISYFVCSGRHGTSEARWSNNANNERGDGDEGEAVQATTIELIVKVGDPRVAVATEVVPLSNSELV